MRLTFLVLFGLFILAGAAFAMASPYPSEPCTAEAGCRENCCRDNSGQVQYSTYTPGVGIAFPKTRGGGSYDIIDMSGKICYRTKMYDDAYDACIEHCQNFECEWPADRRFQEMSDSSTGGYSSSEDISCLGTILPLFVLCGALAIKK
ncbi:MAG: hypothetical protein V1492_03510 [Candidatus Micrarchaeota archaeon]